MGLGYATANRGGCHLNGGYLALLESVGVLTMDPLSTKAKPHFTVFMQDSLDAVSSGGSCLFSAQTLIPPIFFKIGPNHRFTRFMSRILTHSSLLIGMILGIQKGLRFNSLSLMPHAEAVRLVTGFPIYTGAFTLIGARCFNLERLFNLREGLTAEDDSLPKRLTDIPQEEENIKTTVNLKEMLPKYYRVRGWCKDGKPTARKLKYLKIEGIL
jgi:aldehyde:ferredoxin oxidoreductase